MLKERKTPSQKIIIIFLLGILFFISSIVLIFWNNESYKKQIIINAEKSLLEKTEITANGIEYLIIEYIEMIDYFRGNRTVNQMVRCSDDSLANTQKCPIGNFLDKHSKGLTSISIIDLDGNIIHKHDSKPSIVNKEDILFAINYIKKYKKKYISEISENEKGEPVVEVFLPIFENKKLKGVISGTICIKYFITKYSSTLHQQDNIVTFICPQKKYVKNIPSFEIDRGFVEDFLINKTDFPNHNWTEYDNILDSISVGNSGFAFINFPETNKYILAYCPVKIDKHIFSLTIYRDYKKTIKHTEYYIKILYIIIIVFIVFLTIFYSFLIKIIKSNMKLETEAGYNSEIIEKSIKINKQKNKYQKLYKEHELQNNKLRKLRGDLINLNLQLGSNQKKYQNAQKLAKLGYWQINLISQKLELSEELYNIFEIKNKYKKINNEPPYFYMKRIEHADRLMLIEAYEKSIETKTEFNITCSITVNNNKKHVNIRGKNKYNKQGKAVLSRGTIMDITELRNYQIELSKQKNIFETMFNAITDGMVITDTKRRILLANKGMEHIFGYKKEELIGQMSNLIYYNNESFVKIGQDIFNENAKNINKIHTTKYINKNGDVFICDTLGAKLFDEKGKWIGNLALIRNVSERVQMIKDLEQAKNKAQESDRLKSAFLANMSHEIRTPMNGIIGFSDLLGNSDLSAEKREMYISIIQNSSEQLLSIINDIIDISKIEAGQIKIEKKQFNINQLVEELVVISNNQIKNAKKNYKIKFEENTDYQVIYTDPFKLRQVLQNLINNAIKFTKVGYIEIKFLRESNTKIIFQIKDTGIGISNEYHKLIFSQFRQVEEGAARKYGGTGLGLAICKSLVELLGGEIWVESEKDKGSIFSFTIDIATTEE